MRSLLEALELLPLPAALHDCSDFRLVARNSYATANVVRTMEGADDETVAIGQAVLRNDTAELFKITGVRDAARQVCAGDEEVIPVETRWGWMTVSCLRGGPEVSRPDLVLMTFMGSGKSHTLATLAHQRAAALLVVNEHAHRTVQILEDTVMQLRAALGAQQALVQQANQASEEITALLNDTPCGSP